MSEEIKDELKEEKRCNCDKKELKRFLLTILGSFLGCLVALCLYGATVKPQPPQMPCPCAIHRMHNHGMPRFDGPRKFRPDIIRPDMRKEFNNPQNFDRRFEIPPVKPEK